MSDLSTLEGQKAHYRAIRAKFMPPVLPVVRPVLKMRQVVPLSAPAADPAPPPPRVPRRGPMPKQKPSKPVRIRRDWLRVASKGVVTDDARKILIYVAKARQISIGAMMSGQRRRPVFLARAEAMWMMEAHLHMHSRQIAEVFGKDPTSVIHSINRHQERLDARAAK